MKRKLLTQMRTEWRGNIWLLVEFLLISLIIWYVCVNLYGLYLRYNPSKGYDFNNIYVASVGYLSRMYRHSYSTPTMKSTTLTGGILII